MKKHILTEKNIFQLFKIYIYGSLLQALYSKYEYPLKSLEYHLQTNEYTFPKNFFYILLFLKLDNSKQLKKR